MSLNRKTLGKHLERIFAQTREGAVDPQSVRASFVIGGEGTAIAFSGSHDELRNEYCRAYGGGDCWWRGDATENQEGGKLGQ